MRSTEIAKIIGISSGQLNTYLRENMERYTAKKVYLNGATNSRYTYEIEDSDLCISEITKRRKEGKKQLRRKVYGLLK